MLMTLCSILTLDLLLSREVRLQVTSNGVDFFTNTVTITILDCDDGSGSGGGGGGGGKVNDYNALQTLQEMISFLRE